MFLPALQPVGGSMLSGWDVLRTGWRGPTAGVWAWYANPLFVLAAGALLLNWSRVAGVLAGLALVLGLTGFAAAELATASGYRIPALSFAAGSYLWVGTLFALWVWAWFAVYLEVKTVRRC